MLSDQVPYYILDFLQQVPSVYVEGLGRFEAIFHPALMDPVQASIKPPYVEPNFKDETELPAETLASYIHYASGLDITSASEAIDEFVRKVHLQTMDGSLFTIEKFGTFSRNAQDNLRFTPDWDAFNLAFSGLEVLDLRPVAETITTHPVPPPPPVEIPLQSSWPTSTSEAQATITTEHPEHTETNVAQAIEEIRQHQDRIDESTSRLWWIILSSALVLIAVLCAYLAWDIISNRHRLNDLKQVYPDTSASTRVPEIGLPSDTTQLEVTNQPLPEDTIQESLPVAKENQVNENACYVVVGAFSDPENINRMVDRLTSLGYETHKISGRTLTRVAITTSCETSKLQKVLNDARSTINPEAWIY